MKTKTKSSLNNKMQFNNSNNINNNNNIIITIVASTINVTTNNNNEMPIQELIYNCHKIICMDNINLIRRFVYVC